MTRTTALWQLNAAVDTVTEEALSELIAWVWARRFHRSNQLLPWWTAATGAAVCTGPPSLLAGAPRRTHPGPAKPPRALRELVGVVRYAVETQFEAAELSANFFPALEAYLRGMCGRLDG